MRFIAPIAIVGIIALAWLITYLIKNWKEANRKRLREIQRSRDLHRAKAARAMDELAIIKDMGGENSSAASLALMDCAKLQSDFDNERELTA